MMRSVLPGAPQSQKAAMSTSILAKVCGFWPLPRPFTPCSLKLNSLAAKRSPSL